MSFNGNFVLSGRGEDLDAIRRDLDGQLAVNLQDAALMGTDVWYNLRRARAMFKLQDPPPPPAEPKTDISNMSLTGTVTDGILQNDDFVAQLPFMRIEGRGSVNLPEATVDYEATAKILERPEFVSDASEEELAEFTSAEIPLKITGPLAAPEIRPAIDTMFKDELKEKAEEKLLDALLGDEEPAEGQDAEDVLKEKLNDKLKDLFKK